MAARGKGKPTGLSKKKGKAWTCEDSDCSSDCSDLTFTTSSSDSSSDSESDSCEKEGIRLQLERACAIRKRGGNKKARAQASAREIHARNKVMPNSRKERSSSSSSSPPPSGFSSGSDSLDECHSLRLHGKEVLIHRKRK